MLALSRKIFLQVGNTPVSYTHLDVYKRQGHALAPVLKVTGNRDTFERMHDNIDIGVCEMCIRDRTNILK